MTAWTPAQGVDERYAGEEFDVVRAHGLFGLEAFAALVAATDERPGPVILENRSGDESQVRVRFVVPVGTTGRRRWPPGIWVLPRDEAISVPAFHGNTWPYSWLSRPTESAPLVSVDALFNALCTLTGWRQGSPTAPQTAH